ncbi:hypothetical protein GCM10010112_39210 [Actinoplanes lobatus]|uniref:Transcriptional regulator, AbiEi antitoxin, Type IV TA system n=1 Tax=Actinoplanes lobatus TaxID=113568 RepID=A0ABQ4ALF5_9ACTN|nr:hypothetical protein GCM10010112_39210 [Actinoplanes lobatus]GIE41833.1 hypothetical protein Alo02nite_47310 [Actinoplanes lobatus]
MTRAQALRAGMTLAEITHRVRSGRWQRLFAGVYATFTGPVSREVWRWAAVLRAGEGAVLSHRSAAEEVGLCRASQGPLHVTVPAARRVTAPGGVVVHRCRHVRERRHPSRQPPQTRIEETILDLAVGVPPEEAMGWIAAACGARLTTADRLRRALRRRGFVPGRPVLTSLLDDAAEGCASVLEWRYLREVERAHSLPAPARQWRRPRSGGYWYDDLYYPGERLRIELDGQAAHPAETRWRDYRRDNAAVQSGDTVLRYSTGDIFDDPCRVAGQVADVLQRGGWPEPAQPCGPGCGLLPADPGRDWIVEGASLPVL